MDRTLRWYASFIHAEHATASGEVQWADCDRWPCYHLRNAVLRGIPPSYVEIDGAGTY